MFDIDLFGDEVANKHNSILAQSFEYPPFSVLNAREGWWQDRKRQWLALGISSEIGRDAVSYSCNGDAAAKYDYLPKIESGVSIFDPVLTELFYKWFCPAGGLILDPFAGGSVRGIVAATLGFSYQGHELRPEQVDANIAQGLDLCPGAPLKWVVGDSLATIPAHPVAADLVFSCPPYGDLEVYSDEATDLSAMDHDDFIAAYRGIIAASVATLKDDRFACFVVGDYRCKKGFYRNFVGETVMAFEAAGARFYNEAILVTSVGSLPVRITKQFKAGRKLGKTHQNILVFCKGDPKKAAQTCEGLV